MLPLIYICMYYTWCRMMMKKSEKNWWFNIFFCLACILSINHHIPFSIFPIKQIKKKGFSVSYQECLFHSSAAVIHWIQLLAITIHACDALWQESDKFISLSHNNLMKNETALRSTMTQALLFLPSLVLDESHDSRYWNFITLSIAWAR